MRPTHIIRSAVNKELDRQGRTKYWLARQIDMEPKSIYRMLTGESNFTVKYADRMLQALKLRVTK